MAKKPKKHACDDRTDQLNDFIFDGIEINNNDLIAFGERFSGRPLQTDDVGQKLQIAYGRVNVSSFVTQKGIFCSLLEGSEPRDHGRAVVSDLAIAVSLLVEDREVETLVQLIKREWCPIIGW